MSSTNVALPPKIGFRLRFQSAPLRKRRQFAGEQDDAQWFQSTLPSRERHWRHRRATAPVGFNPRPSEKESDCGTVVGNGWVSIHAPLRESDITVTHRGERVSIHQESDVGGKETGTASFEIRSPPKGERQRRICGLKVFLIDVSNPRSPPKRGESDNAAENGGRHGCFNNALPSERERTAVSPMSLCGAR